MDPQESKADLSEGDVNLSPRRADWVEKHLDEETRRLLDEDSRLFLHQSLSTPCLDVLAACEGVHIENLQGRRLLDFHGNNVHQVGFSHPKVLDAVKAQLDELSFCTRRYTNRPAIELAMRWFPGAHFTDGFAAHIGVEASYERAFGIDSVPADPDDERVFPTRSQEWMIGLRGRFPYDDHFFSVGVGYGNHYFIIEPSGPAVAGRGNQPEIPRTEYDFLRLQGEARLALVGGLSLTMGLGYRVVFDSGGIQSEVWFPASTVGGIETDLMVGYRLDNGIEIRLGFDYRRYFYAMNVELTSPWIAGGALDQYIGGSLGIAYRH